MKTWVSAAMDHIKVVKKPIIFSACSPLVGEAFYARQTYVFFMMIFFLIIRHWLQRQKATRLAACISYASTTFLSGSNWLMYSIL